MSLRETLLLRKLHELGFDSGLVLKEEMEDSLFVYLFITKHFLTRTLNCAEAIM